VNVELKKKVANLLRQMLKMWLVVWRCSYLRLHKVMSIKIAGLSKWWRVDVLNLTRRQMGSSWSWIFEILKIKNILK
jgi:hypothetical protein